LNFLERLYEKKILLNSIQWEPTCSMWMDRQMEGQTDMMRLIVTFRHLVNSFKNYILLTEFQFRLCFTWFVFFSNNKRV